LPLRNVTGSPFTVQTTIEASCHLHVVQHLDFGTLAHLSKNVDASGRLSIECTKGTNYKLSLSAGNGAGATAVARKMTGPEGLTIAYGLYRDANRTQTWGDNTSVDSFGGSGDGTPNLIPVYGRIAPQATPAPGTYKDTVVVTLTY
jgi:spore coat protein U-like protein